MRFALIAFGGSLWLALLFLFVGLGRGAALGDRMLRRDMKPTAQYGAISSS